MKLSHESKLRLGVGIGAFVLIIGLVFGVSRTLIHFDGPWDLDDVIPGLSGMDDAVDEDDFMNDGGNYSARPQQLSCTTFDADEFRYLDFDIAAATVDVKVVDGNKARVIERGRVANGMDASRPRRRTSHPSRTRRSRFPSLEVMTVRQSIAQLRSSCRAVLPGTSEGSQRARGLG